MAAAGGSLLAAVLVLVSFGLLSSSTLPACPESCTCHRAPLLNCSSAGLSVVPRDIQDSVSELDLSHNLLESVTLHRPRRGLRTVWLGNNRIAGLTLCMERTRGSGYVRRTRRMGPWHRRGCISWAPTLQLLSVERNRLKQLPEGLEGSESLQVLQLSFNRISVLRAAELSHLHQLKELHLQHNLIASLHPQMFQDLAQLQVLDLSFNMLTSLHPLMYLSLRNIGAGVRLSGNRWQCDCSMRSLRRRVAYDSSRGVQALSVVCASPSILSGRDLLQVEEDELDCSSTEIRPELHQDVTVYSGSEILLSCSAQDSVWWTPSGQASVSEPQAGLLINDVSETDAGLYVCMSEKHKVVSVFNLQISKIEGTRRKTRSLPRTSRQIIPQVTGNRSVQERNQRATQSDLALAVCLSVFITFLIAFILGVLARPCVDVLWRRVTKRKESSETASVSSVEQQQYDNQAYSDGEVPEMTGNHRERRVTFSTVDISEDSRVNYYDTVATGDQESINSGAAIECGAAKAERDKCSAGNSGSESSLQQNSSESSHTNGRELSGITDASHTHKTEFEHIPDPVELEKRRSSSSSSDSSMSNKAFNEDPLVTHRDCSTLKSTQLVEDLNQRQIEVLQMSIEGTGKIPGFSSEPFSDWSPYTNNTNQTGPDLSQENGEQFEFSDSVRSMSTRSSSARGSFNDSRLIVAPTSDKHKRDDELSSSSSSYISEDEPTEYTVNSEQEEDIERRHNKPEATIACLKLDYSFQQQIHDVEPFVGFTQSEYRYDKQRPAVRPEHSFSSHSSDSDGEKYKVKEADKEEGEDKSMCVSDKLSSSIATGEWDTREKVKPMPRTKWSVATSGNQSKSLDLKTPSLSAAHSSSSSSESEEETTSLKVEKRAIGENEGVKLNEPQTLLANQDPQPKGHFIISAPLSSSESSSTDESTTETQLARPPVQVPKTTNPDPKTPWPALDIEHTMHVNRRLDIKAPSPDLTSSSSDSGDEATHHAMKQEIGRVDVTGPPLQQSETVSQNLETQWPAVDLGNITHIKRRLDIKAPSPDSDSSSSSDSEDETPGHIEKQRPGKAEIAEIQTVGHDPNTRWPLLDLEHTTRVKKRLDIKAPSPDSDSSSSSDSGDEATHHAMKQETGKVDVTRPPFQQSQTGSHDPETQWPTLQLEHIPHINRRLDIKVASESSSSSDSEDEATGHIKKTEQEETQQTRPPVQVPKTTNPDPKQQWPVLDLEHATRVKKRLDIKAPSPDSHSSSSSDSEDETSGHIEKQRPGKAEIVKIPLKTAQTVGHDPKTQWPVLDLEHATRIKRRLDIKAPSPDSDSSSSSDSNDETSGHIEKQRPGKVEIAGIPLKTAQTVGRDPNTRWPLLDLGYTTRVKKRLDIKAPSPDSDSSSSSDSGDEATHHAIKQETGKVDVTRPPFQQSQTGSHDPETQWPTLQLEHIPHINRRLDIKVASESSSSSDSEDEATGHIKKTEQEETQQTRPPVQVPKTTNPDPKQQWPVLDLEHATRVKKRLDIKAPSPDSHSSSSSDSEDETSGHIEKQRPGKAEIVEIPLKTAQTTSHDPNTRWPLLDLEHTTRVKKRLDIKTPSLGSHLSSSSNREDETTNHAKKEEKGEIHMAKLPINTSQTANYPKTPWPALDIEHTMHVKRRLDIKAPTPDSDSSSSSDSGDEATHPAKKQEIGRVDVTGPPLQQSETVSQNPETQWPAVDLGNITHIKRRLDVKSASPPPDSLLNSLSANHTVDKTREEAMKMNPSHSSSSSDEQEESVGHLRTTQTAAEAESRWPELGLSSAVRVKRRMDIKAHSPPPPSSASSDESDGGTTQTNTGVGVSSPMMNTSHSPKTDSFIKLEKYSSLTDDARDDTNNFGTTSAINPELELRWASMNLGISRFRKRLEITSHTQAAPNPPSSPPPDSPSSSSNESGTRSKNSRLRRKRREVGTQAATYTGSSLTSGSSLKGRDVDPGRFSEDAPATSLPRQLPDSSSSSNSENEMIGRSVPDLSLGVPRIKRRLNVKAPSPGPSNSSPSSSESEKEVTDIDYSITYKRSIIKVSLPSSGSLNQSQTIDRTSQKQTGAESITVAQENSSHHVGARNAFLAPSRVPGMSFDDVVQEKMESNHTTDVDLLAKIRWTGTSHQLHDLPIPSPRRHLNVGLSSPQRAPPAESKLPPPYPSNKNDAEIKQDIGRVDATLMHKYSSFSVGSGSLASSRMPDKFDSSLGSTSEIFRAVSEDNGKRKGLGALKAMSLKRRQWDTGGNNSDDGASHLSNDQSPGSGTSFNYHRSEKELLAKQPLTQLHLSSTSVDERGDTDVLYGIPRYKRHDLGEAPPPIPDTAPPDAVELTWRSPEIIKKQGPHSTRSYLQQSRNTEEPELLTSQSLAVYFDPSDINISEV